MLNYVRNIQIASIRALTEWVLNDFENFNSSWEKIKLDQVNKSILDT